mmetsp:Transcript_17119/g.42778  ORF Transcript_17119/g.42778 Transcript_17119/m.42778 type:complete len:220 (-) Transcript_17119:984-1643(-)
MAGGGNVRRVPLHLRDLTHTGMEVYHCHSSTSSLCSGASHCVLASASTKGRWRRRRLENETLGGNFRWQLCCLWLETTLHALVQGKSPPRHDAHVIIGRSRNGYLSPKAGADPNHRYESVVIVAFTAIPIGKNQRSRGRTCQECRGGRISTGVHIRQSIRIVDSGGGQPIRPIGFLQDFAKREKVQIRAGSFGRLCPHGSNRFELTAIPKEPLGLCHEL